MRKFKRAVTDSDSRVCYAEGKDGVNNLMTIYRAVTGKTFEQIESEFDGKGYGDYMEKAPLSTRLGCHEILLCDIGKYDNI